jgi:hypothetical protein
MKSSPNYNLKPECNKLFFFFLTLHVLFQMWNIIFVIVFSVESRKLYPRTEGIVQHVHFCSLHNVLYFHNKTWIRLKSKLIPHFYVFIGEKYQLHSLWFVPIGTQIHNLPYSMRARYAKHFGLVRWYIHLQNTDLYNIPSARYFCVL